jgi:DNA-binding GntR family transcriptional regulator
VNPHPYERDFKGVWIPKEIWLSRELSLMEKVLFVEIHSLDNERGCFASNRHFAEFFDVSERQIRTYLAQLKAKGYINLTVTNHHERVIRTAGKFARVSEERRQQFVADYRQLVDNLSLRRTGGRKKTS